MWWQMLGQKQKPTKGRKTAEDWFKLEVKNDK